MPTRTPKTYKVYNEVSLATAIGALIRSWVRPEDSAYSAWQMDSQLYNDVRRFQTGALPEQPAMVTCQFDYMPEKQLESVELSLWSSRNSLVSDRLVIKPNIIGDMECLSVIIAAFARRVEARCVHPRYSLQHKIANCCHSYKCLDCGEVFVIDSSD